MDTKRLKVHFISDFNILLEEAWVEQKAIGWDQVLNGRLSKKWGWAQGKYYSNNPDTKDQNHFSVQLWMKSTVGSFLNFSLELWKDRCGIMYGVTMEEKRKILKLKIVKQVNNNYKNKDKVSTDSYHLFDEPVGILCMKKTQYLAKWLATYRLSARMKKRGGRGKKKERKGRKDGHHDMGPLNTLQLIKIRS